MIKAFKKINNILRILFIGCTGLYALTKIFHSVPEKHKVTGEEDTEHITSEFDEIW